MSVKTFNFTERAKIRRADVRVRLTRAEGATLVSATFALGSYEFPGTSQVWLEALRGLERNRIYCGTIARPTPLDGYPLGRFDAEEGLSFRLIVTEESLTERRGVILGEAAGVRADSDDGIAAGGRSLLPVAADDSLGQLMWRVDFDGAHPVLRVNTRVGGKLWASSPVFRSAVLPACVREVLVHILLNDPPEWPADEPDEQDWRSLWLWWAEGVSGTEKVPAERDDYDAVTRWVEHVVDQFARRHRSVDTWIQQLEASEP